MCCMCTCALYIHYVHVCEGTCVCVCYTHICVHVCNISMWADAPFIIMKLKISLMERKVGITNAA